MKAGEKVGSAVTGGCAIWYLLTLSMSDDLFADTCIYRPHFNFNFALIFSLILNPVYLCYFNHTHSLIFNFHHFINYLFILFIIIIIPHPPTFLSLPSSLSFLKVTLTL